jgi:acetyl-CoA C-acetyltransferase
MKPFRKKVYAAAGYNTIYMGSGRKEFDPTNPIPFETYLKETAEGTCSQVNHVEIDEGIIGNFMAPCFLNQGNLPGFLPFMVPSLLGKPCTGIEGACGSGGRAIATGVKSILADVSDVVFVAGFEIQNTMKSVYGADVLAGASYYKGERKEGHSYFFPGVFSDRAGAYYEKYGKESTRQGMARWFEQSILNARKNPKAQEYQNVSKDLFAQGMTPPNPEKFVPNLNYFDCSKVSDGASSILILSEEGLKRCGIDKSQAVEIVAIGAAEGDITLAPTTSAIAIRAALQQAGIAKEDLGLLELHDCFTITALMGLEAMDFAAPGKGAHFILEGHTSPEGKIPTNLSGGLGGFGHPTGATGVRQLVDLWMQLTGCADNQIKVRNPFGMLVSMGGNDKTVTAIVAKQG